MSINHSSQGLPPGPAESLDLEKGDNKIGRMRALWMQYGDCYRVHSETRRHDTWVINDPALIKTVLISRHRNYTKGVGIERVRVLLGNGLMASEGDLWRTQRRMLQSAFHRARIESMLPIYQNQARLVRQQWTQAAADGEPVNVTETVSQTTLQAVLQALFSEDLLRLEQAGETPFNMVSEDSERNLHFAMKFRQLGRVIEMIVASRRQSGHFPDDILSHMLLAVDKTTGNGMNDRQLVDEVLTLIVAGHETTAACLNWLWFLLAANPGDMDKVCAEAKTLDFDALTRLETLQRLEWIPGVIKEALRLYPPGWLYTRRAVNSEQLGRFDIAAGTDVFICSYLLHRHPAYWEQPDEFRPERFAGERESAYQQHIYLPFSAGPRHCIGENFAMVEMMVHLGMVAASLRPEECRAEPPVFEADVNLRPRDPLYLKFVRAGSYRA